MPRPSFGKRAVARVFTWISIAFFSSAARTMAPPVISMEITGGAIVRAAEEKKAIEIQVNTRATARLPKLGLGISSLSQPLSEMARERLNRLSLMHLRADLRLASPDWKQQFA